MVSVIPKDFNENYVDHRVAYIGNIKPAVFNLKHNDKYYTKSLQKAN